MPMTGVTDGVDIDGESAAKAALEAEAAADELQSRKLWMKELQLAPLRDV